MIDPISPSALALPDERVNTVTLRGLLEATWRGRWILLASIVVASYLGYRKARETGTVFRVESRLLVSGPHSGVLALDGVGATTQRNLANTQAAMLRSSSLLSSVTSRPEVAGTEMLAGVASKVAWLRRFLQVSVGRTDDIITVALESEHAEEAALIVNSLVQEYKILIGSRGESKTQDLLGVLTQRRESLQEQLAVRMAARRAFLEKNSMLALDPQGVGAYELAQLNTFRAELTTAQREARAAREKLVEVQALIQTDRDVLATLAAFGFTTASQNLGGDQVDSVSAQALAGKQEALARLVLEKESVERALASLRWQATESHRGLADLDQRLGTISRRIEDVVDEIKMLEATTHKEVDEQRKARLASILKYLEGASLSAEKRVEEETERVRLQVEVATRAGVLQTEYARLESDVAQTTEMIGELSRSIRELDLAAIGSERLSDMSIDVVEPAGVETATISSSASGAISRYVLLGLIVGGIVTWLRATLDQRIRTPNDLEGAIPISILGVLPAARVNSERADAIHSWERNRMLAEAVRGLRTAILFAIPDKLCSTLQITSAEKGDGKSTVTAHLAISLAQAGHRVLVVDADLRSPRQHRVFQMRNELGVSDILASETPIESAIQATRIDGLDVLTAGPVPANPAEMLNSSRFDVMLEELKGRYDRIIIDSPPVLPVTDARIVATRASATVLVVRSNKSTARVVQMALTSLRGVSAKLAGAVLNAVPRGIGSSYGYGYGYGYGDPVSPTPEHYMQAAGSQLPAYREAAVHSTSEQKSPSTQESPQPAIRATGKVRSSASRRKRGSGGEESQ